MKKQLAVLFAMVFGLVLAAPVWADSHESKDEKAMEKPMTEDDHDKDDHDKDDHDKDDHDKDD